VANGGLLQEMLIESGNDQRLADNVPLGKIVEACERFENKNQYGSNR
jgi:hypothetical protein